MSRVLLFLFILTGACALEGVPQPIADPNPIHEAFISPVRDAGPVAIVSTPPPAPLFETVPARPYDDAVWIPGYWAWSDIKSDFIWVCGVWRRPPPEHIWIPGSWVQLQGGGFAWQGGLWSLVPELQLAYIQKTPPPQANEQIPPSPGQNYFWIRGYWEYEPQTNSFSWLSGRWEAFNQHWILSPSNYVWRQSGFVFVPLFWDYPLEERGLAYSCTGAAGSPLVAVEPGVVIANLYLCYPDYVDIFWHWGFFHPGWWDGCDCLPPWWFWGDWWTFPWGDLWGLWWWWGHPGFFPPFWITLELSLQIEGPPQHLLALFEKMQKPPFNIKLGDTALLPKGPKGVKPLPKPKIPTEVQPGGSIVTPPLPGRFVMPPKAPPQPQSGSQPDWTPPEQQVNPEPVNPNWDAPPPTYIPPRVWIPPRDRGYPSRHGHDEDDDNDHGRPERTPPRGKYPPGKNPPQSGGSSGDITPPKGKVPPRYTPPQGEGSSQGGTSPGGKYQPQYTPPKGRGSSLNTPSQGQGSGSSNQSGKGAKEINPQPRRTLPEMTPRIRERIRDRVSNSQNMNSQNSKGN